MKYGYLALAAFAATIPTANWLIGNVGTECIPNGPCLIPVGFGLAAPSGVLMIGGALVLRDIVHQTLGWRWALFAIFAGAAISGFISMPALVVASVAAFLLSELADMAVYTPLRTRRLFLAVFLSGLVGAFIDSIVFQYLAFGSLDYIAGQTLGKVWLTIAAIPVLLLIRRAVSSNPVFILGDPVAKPEPSASRYVEGGLEERFVIERADGRPIDPSRRYSLVLDFSGADPHALIAAKFYASCVRAENPTLADGIMAAIATPATAPKQHRY